MNSARDEEFDALLAVINALGSSVWNVHPYEPPADTAAAIDGLAVRVQQGTLAITLALLRIAEALGGRGV